jgi:hypothetical protein
MAQRLLSRLFVGLVLFLPIVVSAAQAPKVDFGKQRLPVDFKSPRALPANLSITMPQTGDQRTRLEFSSETERVDASAQRVNVTYTATGLTVEMVSGAYTQITTQTPWQSRTGGDFKTLFLTFASNGQLVSVRPE